MLVGLTGGIGSGKTAVSDAFAKLDVPIIDTDVIARSILNIKPELLETLASRFGSHILDAKGALIRENLRKTAFSNNKNKASLDAIMHPAIRQETLTQISIYKEDPYCIVVVPLLVETDFKSLVDRVLVVTAPYERRIKWLNTRSDLSRNDAEAIISKQTSDEQRLKFANDHINNDGSLGDINEQVGKLHKKYSNLCKPNPKD